jgi:hypothetical protein
MWVFLLCLLLGEPSYSFYPQSFASPRCFAPDLSANPVSFLSLSQSHPQFSSPSTPPLPKILWWCSDKGGGDRRHGELLPEKREEAAGRRWREGMQRPVAAPHRRPGMWMEGVEGSNGTCRRTRGSRPNRRRDQFSLASYFTFPLSPTKFGRVGRRSLPGPYAPTRFRVYLRRHPSWRATLMEPDRLSMCPMLGFLFALFSLST